MALSPEEIEWLKEASKPMSIEEKANSNEESYENILGKEDELINFEFTQEQKNKMKKEFGIEIKD